MAYFTINDARQASRTRAFTKSARTIFNEQEAAFRTGKRFDVFLSHCMKDAEIILGVKELLEGAGMTVYVDWIEDEQLDREHVTPATAGILRLRMQASESMIFATSEASPNSKWMPWELGYFDGLRQERIAVLPLVNYSGQDFKGQEYLGLYPTVEELPRQIGGMGVYVTKPPNFYMPLANFRSGSKDFWTR